MGSDDLAMCRKVGLTLMLYPVISLINRSPALLQMDLTLTQKITGAYINLGGMLNLDGKGGYLFLIRVGVPFLMITFLFLLELEEQTHHVKLKIKKFQKWSTWEIPCMVHTNLKGMVALL